MDETPEPVPVKGSVTEEAVMRANASEVARAMHTCHGLLESLGEKRRWPMHLAQARAHLLKAMRHIVRHARHAD